MASYSSIKCSVRNLWVAATPEEAVRQTLLRRMIDELGFPKGLIAVEKDLSSRSISPTRRRFDVLCYWVDREKLAPLLLVECKAHELNQQTEQQAIGYNRTIQAPFLCLASPSETKTLWVVAGQLQKVPFLPSYNQLVENVCRFFPS